MNVLTQQEMISAALKKAAHYEQTIAVKYAD